jgi:hypothetical protein
MRVRLLLILLALSMQAGAIGLPETEGLVSDDLSRTLLAKEFIYAETGGNVPVDIGSAITLLRQPSFLTRVQEEYESLLPPGKQPEFTVQQSATNSWFYINKKQERTDIIEVASREGADDTFDLAYYTEGRRFFGFYQALIHVQLTGEDESTRYTVAVYAYPENLVSRFFARHLNLVERYFRSKTDEISVLAAQISTRLCGLEPSVEGSIIFAQQKKDDQNPLKKNIL